QSDTSMANAKDTRAAFSGLIEKPVLTDELLARPPFRFILDIVSSTAAKTGYLRDRFAVEALNPAKFKEKTDKTAFLDSLIEAVNDGSLPGIKSAKIVAGKEPELTNMLLIKLAEQAREFQEQNSQPKKKRRPSSLEEPKEKTGKSKHRSESKGKEEKSKKESKEEKNREESKENKNKEESKEEKSKKRTKTKDSKEKTKEKKKKEVTADGTESDHHRSRTKDKDEDKKSSSKKSKKHEKEKMKENIENRDINSNVVEDDQQQQQHVDEPITSPTNESPKYSAEAQSSERTDDSGISDMIESPQQPTIERLPGARPQTSMGRPGTAAARPAPPKLKRKQIAVTEEVAPPQNVVLIPEITDQEKPTPEENFLVEEEEEVVQPQFRPTEIPESTDQRGGLVQKMIDTTTTLKETNLNDTGDVDEGMLAKEKLKTEAFSNSLQTVTRTVYPLSRIFDFAQEDLELILKELDKWLNESKKCESLLKERDAQGIGDSHKLSTVLQTLDADVNNMRSMVNASKARITSNNRRIQELLNDV
uniref:TRAF3-interacting protein 1 n=1 Tax=Haemonchus contortus TaxID=6289 RepID=A0A7I4XUT1_HAECO